MEYVGVELVIGACTKNSINESPKGGLRVFESRHGPFFLYVPGIQSGKKKHGEKMILIAPIAASAL